MTLPHNSSCGPKATLKDSQQWLLGALPRSATSRVGNAIFIVLAPGDEGSTSWEPAGLVSLLSLDTSPMPPSCQSKQKFVPELGYLFHPDYWGKGYATESIAAILNAYREEKLAIQPKEALDIRATVHMMNQASLRVVEKLGFVEIGRHPGRPLPMKPDLNDLTVVHSQWRPKE